jgi:hypothetical protein
VLIDRAQNAILETLKYIDASSSKQKACVTLGQADAYLESLGSMYFILYPWSSVKNPLTLTPAENLWREKAQLLFVMHGTGLRTYCDVPEEKNLEGFPSVQKNDSSLLKGELTSALDRLKVILDFLE